MLFLIFGLGAVLCTYSYYSKDSQLQVREDPVDNKSVDASAPTASQRATYKFFVVAISLFFIQIVAGVLTIHDFVGFTTFFGYNISEILQITITRSWHVQLSILWIATCWIAGSIFILPGIYRQEPKRQVLLINILFGLLVSVVVGMLVGCFLGPKNLLGDHWRLLGNQGWEFVELGKVWQVVLLCSARYVVRDYISRGETGFERTISILSAVLDSLLCCGYYNPIPVKLCGWEEYQFCHCRFLALVRYTHVGRVLF